ncbi:uncharacterized protein LOC118204996 [Stegodyphus dumicola]|uniref:uncharacterized protein LOC118204996 n=1 Tax=Stegodyphus dumicola TaxID=202533 RepID=UPI0015B06DD0|nr:uncharacterized protein LOC118204996 [Stegodyphus dumicola]
MWSEMNGCNYNFRFTIVLRHWLFLIVLFHISSRFITCFRAVSGLYIDSKHQFDLIDGLRIYNNSYPGLSIAEGIHHLSPAVLLQGDARHLKLPAEMLQKVTQRLSQTNEFSFIATLKQEERNTGTIISFSEGNDR